jgi:deazaflavin-dependent oxidoreductase (nitroreductase family)
MSSLPRPNRARPMTAFQERLGRVTVQYMTGLNNVVFRLSAGRVAGHVPSGAPICLLTTTGRKTGRRRTVPLLYLPDGEDLVVVASRGGMNRHPAWFLNVLENPDVFVDTGRVRRPMTARSAGAEERERHWPELVAAYEHFASYQRRTDREIPLVILSPRFESEQHGGTRLAP